MNKGKYLNDVLTNYESDDIISNKLIDLQIDKIGSKEFMYQHAYINKLNMQAVKNILSGSEDFIMQQFVDKDKIRPLIKELFIINSFITFVYPTIKPIIAKLSSIKSYLILYHEACVINLIENFLYNVTACIAADDFIVDMIEYCYKMITKCCNQPAKDRIIEIQKGSYEEEIKKINSQSNDPEIELNEKNREYEFAIAMSCINILRYISDHLNQLPFPVCHHMMNAKDIPLLFVTLMEVKPWIRKVINNKKEETDEIYENNKWIKKNGNTIPKLEGQIWITLFNLLMNAETNKKYEITDFRQNQLLRLRKHFSTILYDAIPQMTELYRSIEQMALMTYKNSLTVNPFIVEMVPQLTNFFKMSEEQIKTIGQKVIKNYFEISNEELREELSILNGVYETDNFEYFVDDPTCANCGKEATKRCSRCQSEWYCEKECQIKRWKDHKESCKVIAAMMKEGERRKQNKKISQTQLNKMEIEQKKELVTEVIKQNTAKLTSTPKPNEQSFKKQLDELD